MFHWTVHLKGDEPEIDLHAAAAVRRKVYSFGGYSNKNNMDQIGVHIFNTLSLHWMKLPPATTTGRGERPLEVPCLCCLHSAVLIEDTIYIWGGLPYGNVLYTFDVDTRGWSRPTVSGTVPEARRDHSACVLGELMYIYGGYNQLTGYTNDIYRLDTTTMVWSFIKTRGTPAPVSSCHSATVIGTKMFVFGGRGNRAALYNNITVFDTETDCWLSMPSAQLLPEGRFGHSAFTFNAELYICGGSNGTEDFKDLWKFSPETFSWTKKVEPRGKCPSQMFRMCCCMVGDRVILFGGLTTPNDLHILDLSPSLKTLCQLAVIQYGLERSGLTHDVRWELEAMTTPRPASPLDDTLSVEYTWS